MSHSLCILSKQMCSDTTKHLSRVGKLPWFLKPGTHRLQASAHLVHFHVAVCECVSVCVRVCVCVCVCVYVCVHPEAINT